MENFSSKELSEILKRFNKVKSELKSENTSTSHQITELQQRNRTLEETIQKTNEKLNETKSNEKESNQNSEDIQKKLRAEIQELEVEKQNNEKNTKHLTQIIAKLESEAHENSKKLGESLGALKSKEKLDNQLKELEKENATSLSNLQKDLEDARNKIQMAEKEKVNLDGQIKDLSKQIEILQLDLKKVETTQGDETLLRTTNEVLEKEVAELKKKIEQEQNAFEKENKSLQASAAQIQKENNTLNVEKYSQQQVVLEKNQNIQKLEGQIKNLQSQTTNYQKKLNDFEHESKLKDKQIEGLKFDVSQMKNFILQNHGDTLFEQSAIDKTEQKSPKASDSKALSENLDVLSNSSFREGNELSENFNKSSKFSNKGSKNTQVIKSQTTWDNKGSKVQRMSANNPVRSEESVLDQLQTSGKIKSRKELDTDPIYKKLEGIIKELNEKLMNSEKNAKKQVEGRVSDETKKFLVREEDLLREIEDLKQERSNLAKKIDDIEWEKAYEHNEKTKKEKADLQGSAVESVKSQSQVGNTEPETKKKKKKKNKAKTAGEENI